MIFEFVIAACVDFSEIQEEVRVKFWKNQIEHNYRQIIFQDVGTTRIPIKNEEDWRIIRYSFSKDDNIKLSMAFIAKSYTSIADATKRLTVPYHVGTACNGCRIEPIIGRLYKCIECPNFYLCELCEENKRHSQHMILNLPRPQTKDTATNADTHTSIECNGCEAKPIIGFRYKCILCDNRNFCEICNKNKQLQCMDHGLLRIPKWYGESVAETVVTKANATQFVYDRQFEMLASIDNKVDKLLEVSSNKGQQEAKAINTQKDLSIYKIGNKKIPFDLNEHDDFLEQSKSAFSF